MGYVLVHAIDPAAQIEALAQLPSSIEWRLFKNERDGRYFLDHGYHRGSQEDVAAFAQQPFFGYGPNWSPTKYKFDASLDFLNRLASLPGFAEQMARPVIHYALLVSHLVQSGVFFSIYDYQGHDCVIKAKSGQLTSVKFSFGTWWLCVDVDGLLTWRRQFQPSDPANRIDLNGSVALLKNQLDKLYDLVSEELTYNDDDVADRLNYIPGILSLTESYSEFGYRLACFEDVYSDLVADGADTFVLKAQSEFKNSRRDKTKNVGIFELIFVVFKEAVRELMRQRP